MPTRYVRVRDKATGHEYDVLKHRFDKTKHELLDRYPETSRPRRAKPLVSVDGGTATPGPRPDALSARSGRAELDAAAVELGIEPSEFDNRQKLFAAITAVQAAAE